MGKESLDERKARRQKEKIDRFNDVAPKRVQRAIESIRGVANLASRTNYEYDSFQVQQIHQRLQDELDYAMKQFAEEFSFGEEFSFEDLGEKNE
tara:strand:+ start:323 stop:604 length:282 start_codon:yes stop_codon:yes gene_type:complete